LQKSYTYLEGGAGPAAPHLHLGLTVAIKSLVQRGQLSPPAEFLCMTSQGLLYSLMSNQDHHTPPGTQVHGEHRPVLLTQLGAGSGPVMGHRALAASQALSAPSGLAFAPCNRNPSPPPHPIPNRRNWPFGRFSSLFVPGFQSPIPILLPGPNLCLWDNPKPALVWNNSSLLPQCQTPLSSLAKPSDPAAEHLPLLFPDAPTLFFFFFQY
jgi:hypothetical protein